MSDTFHDGLPTITSRKNDRLRLVKRLRSRRGRRVEARFLLEGPKVIAEVLERNPGAIEQILYRAETLTSAARRTLVSAREGSVPCYPVEKGVFDAVAPTETPQPLLGVAQLTWKPLADLLGEGDEPRAVAACVGVQDPGNLGTILRTAWFLGFAGAVVLPGTQDPFSPKVVRSSTGALFSSPPARADDLAGLLAAAKAAGMQTVALVPRGGITLARAELPARALLLLGAEGSGLDDAVSADADVRVTIPTPQPEAESLNVAVAFAVVAHAWCGQWRGEEA